jgi:hypothetical protein
MLIPVATAAVLTAAAARIDAEAPAMKGGDRDARAESALAALEALFDVDITRHTVRVEYSVRNKSSAPLMVLDRGIAAAGKVTRTAPLTKIEGDALTLTHAAMPLPKPAPTVPRVPLATRIESHATHSATIDVELPFEAKRVRYCIGVAPFSEDKFTAMQGQADVWRASFAVAESQTLLCSAWFDVGATKSTER